MGLLQGWLTLHLCDLTLPSTRLWRSPRRCSEAIIAGSVGDALDNALMESTIGLHKTELIDRQRSWTGRNEIERQTAAWVHWFNTERLHSALDYRPPVEFEDHYRDTTATADLAVA
ncbi:transposase InsO family protein [Geodermatophilus bullaregiensis]|nr:transposase InsO family protein [Geodermatophilus bullaregiensis]